MKKSLLFIFSIFTFFCLTSCGSTPKSESETETPQAPVVEEVEEEVKKEVSQNEIDLILANINSSRDKAIEVGADSKAPDQLKQIDDYFNSIKDDKDKLKSQGGKIADLYEFLGNYIKAKDAKQEIDENNFAPYAQDLYNSGVEKLNSIEAAYNNLNDINSVDEKIANSAKEAYGDFYSVLNVAYKKIAKEERSLAYEQKKNADSVRAGIAQKARYKAAAESFQKGDQLYAMQSPKKAIDCYKSAKEEFATLYKEVGEKRAAAQKAIEEAKKAVADSADYAVAADEKSPITGENIDGIEDEDAVLLESDNYENPEDAEIDFAETIEEQIVKDVTETVETVVETVESSVEEENEVPEPEVIENVEEEK